MLKAKDTKWPLHKTILLLVTVKYILDFKVAVNSKIEYGRL
jgi:hypothetical protein